MPVAFEDRRVPLCPPLLDTQLENLPPPMRGKVRDVYDLGDTLLLVATDRLSAFDHVLASGVPDKGRVLTELSAFWFDRTRHLVPNHLISTRVDDFPAPLQPHRAALAGRSMLVRKTVPLPIECVARGYLAGSGWNEYAATGRVCGIPLPAGLRQADRLPTPIFTPATKASVGHDINITAAEAAAIVGEAQLARLRDRTLALYAFGHAHAEACGLILADTKFEFGLAPDGALLLIDEAMTPDSSRYWPADAWRPGGPQPSFDKQYVRDYLEEIGWNKQAPAPGLPADVVARTRDKYLEALARLTGR
jgi:phosphoribosylaminoimidazole-succinocarboxamide synthase